MNLHKIGIESKKILVSKKINTTIPLKKLSATTLATKEGVSVLLFPSTNSIHQKGDSLRLLVFNDNLKENKKITVFYTGVRDGAKALDGILASHSFQMGKNREIIFVQKRTSAIDIFEQGKQIQPYKMPKGSNSTYLDIFTKKIYDYNIANKTIDYQGISVYDERKHHLIDIMSSMSIFDNQIFFSSKKTGNLCFYDIKSKKFVEIPGKNGIGMRHFVNGSYSKLIYRVRDSICIKMSYYQ